MKETTETRRHGEIVIVIQVKEAETSKTRIETLGYYRKVSDGTPRYCDFDTTKISVEKIF